MFKNVYLYKIKSTFKFPIAFFGGIEGMETPGQFFTRIFLKL
jgi:hypothetical protein